MNEPIITITGNLTADPALRFTGSGVPVANFTIANTPRHHNRQTNEWDDGETMFIRCTAWKDLAENCAETLHKGTRILATGRLTINRYTTDQGTAREGLNLNIDDIGPSLRRAKATITKTTASARQSAAGWQAVAGEESQDPAGNLGQVVGPGPAGGSGFDDMPPF
ncbi:single-stranded DNA-binding protein [Actinobaculum massiliense]|uniref:single-stranded DNA-binding protein n=1 Tax=Actinobaculum massiliense TaxID=202789 RepID=UPI00071AF1A6|nr:single-stranded DNA-binding protein [Actinobaculum massiliense]